jgi:hypothetical protein
MKRRCLWLVLATLLFIPALYSQAVVVTATITSTSGGQPYFSGNYQVSLVDAGGNPLQVSGYQSQFTGSLSSAGLLSLPLFPNSQIQPGSQWRFQICSARPQTLATPSPAPSPSCLSLPVTITSAGDISSTLNAAAPVFYACTEWSGSAWQACGGSGTFNQLSGDATSTSTGGATEVVGLLNNALPSLSTGFLNWSGTQWLLTATPAVIHSLSFTAGAPGGSALSTGVLGYVVIPNACTLTAWDITADAGTATVQTWKVATGTAIPTVANTLSTSGVSLSTGTTVHSTTLTDFSTTAFAAHDVVAANLGTVATAAFINFQLEFSCAQ